MSSNDYFWLSQHQEYQRLQYEKKIKYESWQPARWSSNQAAIRRILPNLSPIKSVCEIGAGTAAFSLEFFRHNPCFLTAVDSSSKAAQFCLEIAEDMKIPITYYVENLFNYSKKHDFIVSLGVIEHFTTLDQIRFIQHCKSLSNKYILIAIPNQSSIIFNKYVSPMNKQPSYEDYHYPLDIHRLKILIKQQGLNILMVDGFQIFLSKSSFWGNIRIIPNNIYDVLKSKTTHLGEHWQKFPFIDFTYNDIPTMVNLEMLLTNKERIQIGFMNYILASV